MGIPVFDLSFDSTFGVRLLTDRPTVPGCRVAGVQLHWLAETGWMQWVFEGPMLTRHIYASEGSRRQAGVTIHNQKTRTRQLAIRTSGLSVEQIEAIATVYASPGVYLLAYDSLDKVHAVPVSIDPVTVDLLLPRQNVHELEVIINLPTFSAQRA